MAAANRVLFQRIWHRSDVQLSNGLLTGKWQRGSPKLQVLFSAAVPGLGKSVTTDGVRLFLINGGSLTLGFFGVSQAHAFGLQWVGSTVWSPNLAWLGIVVSLAIADQRSVHDVDCRPPTITRSHLRMSLPMQVGHIARCVLPSNVWPR